MTNNIPLILTYTFIILFLIQTNNTADLTLQKGSGFYAFTSSEASEKFLSDTVVKIRDLVEEVEEKNSQIHLELGKFTKSVSVTFKGTCIFPVVFANLTNEISVIVHDSVDVIAKSIGIREVADAEIGELLTYPNYNTKDYSAESAFKTQTINFKNENQRDIHLAVLCFKFQEGRENAFIFSIEHTSADNSATVNVKSDGLLVDGELDITRTIETLPQSSYTFSLLQLPGPTNITSNKVSDADLTINLIYESYDGEQVNVLYTDDTIDEFEGIDTSGFKIILRNTSNTVIPVEIQVTSTEDKSTVLGLQSYVFYIIIAFVVIIIIVATVIIVICIKKRNKARNTQNDERPVMPRQERPEFAIDFGNENYPSLKEIDEKGFNKVVKKEPKTDIKTYEVQFDNFDEKDDNGPSNIEKAFSRLKK